MTHSERLTNGYTNVTSSSMIILLILCYIITRNFRKFSFNSVINHVSHTLSSSKLQSRNFLPKPRTLKSTNLSNISPFVWNFLVKVTNGSLLLNKKVTNLVNIGMIQFTMESKWIKTHTLEADKEVRRSYSYSVVWIAIPRLPNVNVKTWRLPKLLSVDPLCI